MARIDDILRSEDWVYSDFKVPETVEGDFYRITIHPDSSSKGTLEIDDPFFSEPPQAVRDAFMKRHQEFPALTDYIELQDFMRYVSLPSVSDGQKIQCWWTPSGWQEYGENILEKAKELGLNPKLQKTTILRDLIHIDNNQVIVNLKGEK